MVTLQKEIKFTSLIKKKKHSSAELHCILTGDYDDLIVLHSGLGGLMGCDSPSDSFKLCLKSERANSCSEKDDSDDYFYK